MSAALRLTGTLARNAQCRIEPAGQRALLCLEVRPLGAAADAPAAQVRHVMGRGPAAGIACSRTARYLRQGMEVAVEAAAWSIGKRPARLVIDADALEYEPMAARCEVD